MKSNLYKINFTALVLTFMFLSASQVAIPQRSRKTPPARRSSVSTKTDLTNDQALRIAAILQGATASIAPGEQPTQKQLNGIAKTQVNDILNVLTPAQKRQIGYWVQIVDPESGIDLIAKTPCISPDFVNALRKEIRYIIAGDVGQAAASIHPVMTWYENRTMYATGPNNPYESPFDYLPVLSQSCMSASTTSCSNKMVPEPKSQRSWIESKGRYAVFDCDCRTVEVGRSEVNEFSHGALGLEVIDENLLCSELRRDRWDPDGTCPKLNAYIKTGPTSYAHRYDSGESVLNETLEVQANGNSLTTRSVLIKNPRYGEYRAETTCTCKITYLDGRSVR